MSSEHQRERLASLTAEAVLQLIFGDDLAGCNTQVESVATLIGEALKQRDRQHEEILGLYEKVVQAVDVLSTAPESSRISNPLELQSLLTERLDRIHTISKKTMEMTAAFGK